MADNQETAAKEAPQDTNAVDLTPDKDGGVLKEIKREGVGEERPSAGDKVSVHYVGTLTDGTQFDSSRDRGEYFEFDLGKGSVIKAWDLGVATMRRGELAVLTCTSKYAYGEKGSPPTIPPDATLVFEVELFNWHGEDISPKHNGSIERSRISPGDGYATPNEGATVDVHMVGKYEGTVFEDREVSFALGEGAAHGISTGLEHALKKFKKGEESVLKVKSEHGFGDAGCPEKNIPGGAELEYNITMKNFEKAKESWEMNIDEKLEQSEIQKAKGTNYFKDGKYAVAGKLYDKIVTFLDGEGDLEGEEKTRRDTLLLAAHLNLAMCCLKTTAYTKARDHCDKALVLDASSEKGLFRRGQAHMQLQDLDLAMTDFKAVLAIDANNKAAKNQVIIVQQKMKAEKEREKKMYGGMFQRFADMDAKKAAQNKEEQMEESEKESEKEKESENGVDKAEESATEKPQSETSIEA